MSDPRVPLIAGNWKMYKTLAAAGALARDIRQGLKDVRRPEVALAPPFTALTTVAPELAGSAIRLAAQDTFWEREGAYTGAISPWMLKDAGCHYVIVGHSERRQYFGETDQTVNRKLKAVQTAELCPIFCVGETIGERQQGRTLEIVGRQVRAGLAGLTGVTGASLVVAYEPVWAIGTGLTATPEQAQEVHFFIRGLLQELLTIGSETRILYGGSVNPENSASLLSQADIDGALVGGASLKADSFLKIIAAAS
jgi:triosephosphate isomerase